MATLNFATREISTKIVYFGAVDAGVSTNVKRLADGVLPSRRTEVMPFAPPDMALETLCFETTLPQHQARSFPVRATIYGLPGGLLHPGLRNEVLRDVDGIVFVADARPEQDQANIDTLLELERVLRDQGTELTGLPIVLQVNHTDAPDARTAQAVGLDLNPYGFPVHSAVARQGEGVSETLDTVVGLLCARINSALSGQTASVRIEALHDPTPLELEARVSAHLASIEAAEEQARQAADPRVRFANLSFSGSVRVRYQNESLRGTRPTQVLSAELDGEDIVVDLIHERINGGHPRRIKLVMENRPTDMEVLPRPRALVSTGGSSHAVQSATANLPDRIEVTAQVPTRDLPPLAYGLIGVTCGLVLGLLLGVIFFL